MEHIGDMCAISSTVGKDFLKEPGLHRTGPRCPCGRAAQRYTAVQARHESEERARQGETITNKNRNKK